MSNPANWKNGAKRSALRDLLYENGNDPAVVYGLIESRIGTEPFVWTNNPTEEGESRTPAPMTVQRIKARYMINEIAKNIAKFGIPTGDRVISDEPVSEPIRDHGVEWLVSELDRVRDWIEVRTVDGDPFDEISLRPYVYGARMIKAGISAKAALYAMAMHWTPAQREDARIEDAPPLDLDAHLKMLATARIPILLVGPAGSGKSTRTKLLANALGMEHGQTGMNGAAAPSWLLGAHTLDGYKSRKLLDRFEKGGIFNFDEIDGADPNLMLCVNDLIIADTFDNPITNETLIRSKDFIPTATANTMTGRGGRYGASRRPLDPSQIDRWRMGRVFVPFDGKLAHKLAFAQ